MKKTYIQPESKLVKVNLTGSVLEGDTIGGQSNNPVGGNPQPDPSDVEFSAKGQGTFEDNDEWPKSSSPWE